MNQKRQAVVDFEAETEKVAGLLSTRERGCALLLEGAVLFVHGEKGSEQLFFAPYVDGELDVDEAAPANPDREVAGIDDDELLDAIAEIRKATAAPVFVQIDTAQLNNLE